MKALELKAKLNHLTLAGYENGEYQWIGTANDWDNVTEELTNHYWSHVAKTNDDYDGLDYYLSTFNLE